MCWTIVKHIIRDRAMRFTIVQHILRGILFIASYLIIDVQDFDCTPDILDKVRRHFRHAVLYPLDQNFSNIGIGDMYGAVIMQPVLNNRCLLYTSDAADE